MRRLAGQAKPQFSVWPRPDGSELSRLAVRLPACDHMPQYSQLPPLTNQNFLVILAGFNCPTDVPADPGKGDFVNSNTLVHKPLP